MFKKITAKVETALALLVEMLKKITSETKDRLASFVKMLMRITVETRATLTRSVPRKLLAVQNAVQKTVSQLRGLTSRRILLEFLILIVLLSSAGFAVSRWSVATIASHGNLRIEGVGVYSDRDCIAATAYLDWGTLEPGAAREVTVYVRNEGNREATIFLTTENWRPVNASSYIHLDWNYSGETLDPMDVARLTLTLSVSSAVENILDFSFDVVIGAN
jgi:hypothetical protein